MAQPYDRLKWARDHVATLETRKKVEEEKSLQVRERHLNEQYTYIIKAVNIAVPTGILEIPCEGYVFGQDIVDFVRPDGLVLQIPAIRNVYAFAFDLSTPKTGN